MSAHHDQIAVRCLSQVDNLIGGITLLVCLGLSAPGTAQFTPFNDRSRAILEGNWQSSRETDGPYTEAKDLVGGFTLVDARAIDQAVELSHGCPILEGGGSVEVRPVMKMDF